MGYHGVRAGFKSGFSVAQWHVLRWVLVALALTGCDKVFGFDSVPATPVDAAPDASMAGTWSAVTAGYQHTCAIKLDGTLWCWGRNDNGQLGIASTDAERDTPTQVAGSWKHVATLYLTTCAIDSTDQLYCWGASASGQAGVVMNVPVRAPNLVDNERWLAVQTGYYTSCGITMDGTAKCWGSNTSGEAGVGAVSPSPITTPTAVDSTRTFASIGGGASNSCAITSDDSTLWCWGYGAYGQLGQGDTANRPSPAQVQSAAWLDVAGGVYATCGVLATGHLRCWGYGPRGELGDPTMVDVLTPNPVGTDAGGFTAIDMALEHACARTTDGALWCWGENDGLQLANTTVPATDPVPARVPGGPGSWLAAGLGASDFCGLGTDHALYCMGLTYTGAIGDGSGSIRDAVALPVTATQLAAGGSTTCSVDAANLRSCWGANAYGQLGDGTTRLHDTPEHVGSGGLALAVGATDSCVIDATGHLQCAGASPNDELDPMATTHLTPTDVEPAYAPYGAVALGNHTCAITDAGALYCWGYDVDGEVGNNTMGAAVATPQPIAGTWSQVAVGDYHTCGIDTTGVKCWGYGAYAELGDGTGMSRLEPTAVSTASTTGTIYSSGYGACLLSAGALACWGLNSFGQLGTGVPAQNYAPMPVTGTYTSVSLGRNHTCAIDGAQHLWCWGSNTFGELGDGTLTSVGMPEPIGSATWMRVAVGDYHTCGIQSDGTVWCWGLNNTGQVGVPRVRDNFYRLP